MKKLILIIALLISASALWAYDFSAVCGSGQTLYYNITSSISPYTVEVTKENESSPYYNTFPTGSLTIPSAVTYNGNIYNVTSIGGSAFRECSGLTSVTISNSVTSIGICAFDGCSGLTSVTIPNSVKEILRLAFYNSGLTSINIPSSVTYIGEHAFYNTRWCNNQSNGILYSNDWCLGYKGDKPTGTLVINEGTKGIAAHSFFNCIGISSVVMPNSVTSIGEYAFSNCSISEPVYNDNCFAYFPCGYATEYTIPDGIKQISGGAFSACSDLISVTIPNSVTSIDYAAFFQCTGLASLTLPDSLKDIGYDAFKGCNGIRGALIIPNSVTSIGPRAFSGCSGFTGTLTIPESVTKIEEQAFSYCSGFTETLTIPNSITSISENVFSYCEGLTSIVIPNSVTSIGWGAFKNCSSVTSIVIPTTVTSIGYYAFKDCPLTNIYSNPIVPPSRIESSSETLTIFTNYDATLWVPCGSINAYATTGEWASFDDIREHFAYELSVSSSNPQCGNASIIQQPDCNNNGTAIITATPTEECRFVQWNDGNNDNPRTVIVTEDITYTAFFEFKDGIGENSIESNFNIFPNPANDILNITSSETISEIEIVNVMGQVVKRMEINSDNAVCNLEDLTSGIYVVNIHSMSLSKGAIVVRQKFRKE